MILSVPILGVLKSFLQATDHPYAQVCSCVLEGSIGKAIRSWETARHRLIASASALSPNPHHATHAAPEPARLPSDELGGPAHTPHAERRRAGLDHSAGARAPMRFVSECGASATRSARKLTLRARRRPPPPPPPSDREGYSQMR